VKVEGVLHGFFETGTEGTLYAIQDHKHIDDKGFYSYDGLHIIKPGDHLTIYHRITGDPKEILFNEKIKATYKCDPDKPLFDKLGIVAGYKSYPANPSSGQLHIGNYWVHWLPTNVDMLLWYKVFFSQDSEYTGVLERNQKA